MNTKKKITGQSTLEILIALAIITIAMSAIIVVSSSNQSISIDTENANQALYLAQEALETARAESKNVFGSVISSTTTDGIYTKQLIVEDTGPFEKKVTSLVSWSTDPLRVQSVELVTYLTILDVTPPLGSNCSSDPLSGDWTQPRTLGQGDLGPGNEGTDVAIKFPYAFVSGVAAASAKPDIFAFDVSNPASPQLIGQLDIGADGINSIFIKDNYLYAASANDLKEFMVINITNPSLMVLASSLDLPGTADGLSVMIFGDGSAAVGRATNEMGDELYFIDATDSLVPSVINSESVSGSVNDFAVGNEYIYAVTGDLNNDIRTYDITDPLSPSFVSAYNVPSAGEKKSISFQPGGILFLGTATKLESVDASDPENMELVSSFTTSGTVNDFFCVAGDLGFLATANGLKEFLVANVSDPAAMTEYGYFNFPQIGTGIDYAENIVYMSVRSNDALRIITSTP